MDPNNPYNQPPGYVPPQTPGGVVTPGYQAPGANPYPAPTDPYGQQPAANQGYSQQPLQPNPYAGYNPNPYPGEMDAPKRRGPNKMVIGIVIIVLVLAGGGAAAYVYLQKKNNTPAATSPTPPPANTVDASADIVPRDDGQLDLSAKVDTNTSIKEQTVKAKQSEQINLSSGFSFMVTKAETYTPADATIKPGEGKQFISVSVSVGNRAKNSDLSVSYLDFKLRDTSNNLITSSSVTQTLLGNSLSDPTSLKSGDQTTGKIIFEVSTTDKSWTLVHKETYQRTTDNTTLSVEGDVNFSLSTAPASPSTSPTSPTPANPPATLPSGGST